MADFLETFDSLAAWDFGTGPTEYLELASTSPTPFAGASRGTAIMDAETWAAAIFDEDDGGVAGTLYWMSYAFYLSSWADIWNDTEFAYVGLPGFINRNDDPTKGQFYGSVDDVEWIFPYLEADDVSTGHINPYGGDGASIADGQWHTVRYGVRLNGASSHETLYVNNTLVFNEDLDYSPGGDPYNAGIHGVVVFFEDGITNPTPYALPIDTIMYSAAGDPGEPTEDEPDPFAVNAASVSVAMPNVGFSSAAVVNVGVDLSPIVYRAFEMGDVVDSLSLSPTVGSPSESVSLAGVQFRSKYIGDGED